MACIWVMGQVYNMGVVMGRAMIQGGEEDLGTRLMLTAYIVVKSV